MREASASNFTLIGQLKGFGFGLIAYAIIALILGAILKKKDKSLDF
jgi:phage shock protein PspC (stress-responsive transcriptional regulator)